MNKKSMIFIVALSVVFVLAVKLNLMPTISSEKLYNSVKIEEAKPIIKHKDGVEKDYYSNGNLRTETPYKNNMREGIVKTYYANGTVKSEADYHNDKQNGETKTYDKNGNLEKIYTYQNDQLNGPARSFDKDGNLTAEATFKK